MIASLVSKVTSNMLWVVVIVLATLAVGLKMDNTSISKDLNAAKQTILEYKGVNERNQLTIDSLKDELLNMPKEYITITKEVSKEVCQGKVLQEKINNLPQGTSNEKDVVDIDGRLPADLNRLLQ
jgi:hypothetical protein